MKMIRYVILICIFLAFGCDNFDKECFVVGEPKEVKENHRYCIDESSMIRILEFTSSYCPCDVVCVWDGEAIISIERIVDELVMDTFSVHEILEMDNVYNLSIAEVRTDGECEPSIEKIWLIRN